MTEGLSLPDVVEEIMKAVVQIKTPGGQGTGFFIRDDGLVITNKHVVGNDVFVKVRTKEGLEYDGQVCKGDSTTDYAFLFTNAPCKKILSFADSESVRVAETVVAIGHPYGYDFTVSEGIVSAIERHEVVPGLNSVGFLQLDAGINPGNSGGPLIRKSGEVLGMITMTLLDEVMTWAAILHARQPCVAAEVSTRLRKPIAVGEPLRVEVKDGKIEAKEPEGLIGCVSVPIARWMLSIPYS